MNFFQKNSEDSSYTQTKSFEERLQESKSIREKYPFRVPCIVERSHSAKKLLPKLDKFKYLVPDSLTFGQFVIIIRKRLHISSDHALFLFAGNNVLPPVSSSMKSVYDQFASNCGFLYITYTTESVFGKI